MCTSIFQIAYDHSHLLSRTMDWHGLYAFPLFVPRGYKWSSVYDGKEYINKYAAIGSGHDRKMHADLSDGVNEFGLSVQKLTFANASRQYAKTRNEKKIQLAPFEFAFWAMTNFRSVQELIESLPSIEVINDNEALNKYGDADLHYAAADPSGRFVIIEPLSMPMRVIENPLGVVTNAPNFKREVNKLNDYMPLLPEYLNGQLSYNSQHVASKDFSGKKQLPGGYTPSARFIRAAYLKERSDSAADQEEQLVNARNILNSVTVPKMSSRSDTYTVYRSAVALETRTLYYENYSATGLFKLVLNDSLLEQSKEIFFQRRYKQFSNYFFKLIVVLSDNFCLGSLIDKIKMMSTFEEQLDRQKHIRNFSIVAHIDHGKSTLADRILEMTHSVAQRQMKAQILDDMPLERERGITIKMNSVEVHYDAKDGQRYIFHLIDTPGHVDFSYEVSRALAAADGALLVVDATQGVQAQTLANVYLAIDNDLEILPVINKIDLPSADPKGTKAEIEDDIGIDTSDAADVSAKTGLGVADLLEKIVKIIPAPTGDLNAPLQALIFDSKYDSYRGVVLSIRVKEGQIHLGDKIRLMNAGADYEVTELGVFFPDATPRKELIAGDVGYLTASIKDIHIARSGDTVTNADRPAQKALQGYRPMTPMVYAGIYPTDNGKYNELRDALDKLSLNDASLEYEPETSTALGFGFRVGFLGLLHMDVVQERLEREFDLEIVITAPTVTYHVIKTDGSEEDISNPSDIPDASSIKEIREPFVNATIMVPEQYVGTVMELAQAKRGIFDTMDYLDKSRVNVKYKMPLSEIIFDFFDKIKSSTKGYASLDYSLAGFFVSDLKKIDILLNGDKVDALSFISHKDFADNRARVVTGKLKKVIPRQNFEIPIQAAIGSKIIARTNIKAYRKDVTVKIHTGDPDRRAKLLDKQRAGKARMKSIGRVDVPQEAFMAILKNSDDEQYNKGLS